MSRATKKTSKKKTTTKQASKKPTATRSSRSKPYHHGDLRRALLDAAIESITEAGSASFSLRDLARRIGVSHAAPAHHFGDKTGLLTALAVEGYQILAEAQARVWEETGSFLEVGVAYVRFAVEHPAHFEVMYRPDLLHTDDPELVAAHERSRQFLYGPAGALVEDDALGAGLAGWALAHGVVSLWASGNLPAELGGPEDVMRLTGQYLFPPK